MEIKLNFEGMKKAVDTYDIYDDELNSIKEDLVDIITDVDDYWIGRFGNSFKYICWYLKLLLDMGTNDFGKIKEEIKIAKSKLYVSDYNLSNQIQSKE